MDLWWVFLAIGAVVGFMAGLLGIGGGMILVPILLFMFTAQGPAAGFPQEHLMHMALATSMATIPFTSVSSVRAHHVRGGVDWTIVVGMLPGLAVGAMGAALVAGLIPGRPLAIFFAAFIFYAATNMFFNLKPAGTRVLPGRLALGVVGALVSFLAAFVAAGAAFMTIPFMVWCNVPLKRAVGTAAAIGFPLGLAASIGYVFAGLRAGPLPPWSLGFIYLPALALIVIPSVFFAPLGARASHRMPIKGLRIVFALTLYAIAIRMVVSLW
ncbi:MAG: sulfite exporter TauE/SafE family protein [Betaproteobacteria bacterium]